MDLQIFIPPIVGAAIGYITNDIAIKMLFRPRKSLYIGKFHIPFTPGLIPREKDRIARSIGSVVSQQLLDSNTLKKVLTSEKIVSKIRSGINTMIDMNRSNNDTLEETLMRFAPEHAVNKAIADIKTELVTIINEKIQQYPIGEIVSKSVLSKITEKLSAGTFGLFANFIDSSFATGIAKSIGDHIDTAVRENSEGMIRSLIDTEIEKISDHKVSEIIDKYDTKLPAINDLIVSIYLRVIGSHLDDIMAGIDIAGIIKNKINSFDVIQLEEMIFSIMKKELKAIVYLGALLGFIMGWINLLVKI